MTEPKGSPPEKDYFKVKNDWWDALTRYRLSGEQMQILLHIIRKTYGWKRKEWPITFTEFEVATGMKRPSVNRALKALRAKNLIGNQMVTNNRVSYWFNKYYKTWVAGNQSVTGNNFVTDNGNCLVTDAGNQMVTDSKILPITSKDNIKTVKDIIAKNGMDKKARAILRYLNRKKKSKYRDYSFIIPRLNDGATIQECLTVIDNKFADEYFIENPRFLNPETLFRKSKFDKYLNDTDSKPVRNYREITENNLKVLKEASDERRNTI